MLQALQLLGRGDLPGVEALLVALGPGPHLVDVALGLGQLAGEVALLGLGADDAGRAATPSSVSSSASAACSGRVAAPVRELVEAGVERLHVEQAQLVGGGGFQWGLLRSVVVVAVT